MAKLKWKRRAGSATERACYRLRRGDVTLAAVVQDGLGAWYFYGRVPGGGTISTLGAAAPLTSDDVEVVRRAAVEWVKAEEAKVAAREVGRG